MPMALVQLLRKQTNKNKLLIPKSELRYHSTKANLTSETQTTLCAQPHGDGGSSDVIEDFARVYERGRLKERLDTLHRQGIGTKLSSYASLLEDCVRRKALAEGKLVHAHMIESG